MRPRHGVALWVVSVAAGVALALGMGTVAPDAGSALVHRVVNPDAPQWLIDDLLTGDELSQGLVVDGVTENARASGDPAVRHVKCLDVVLSKLTSGPVASGEWSFNGGTITESILVTESAAEAARTMQKLMVVPDSCDGQGFEGWQTIGELFLAQSRSTEQIAVFARGNQVAVLTMESGNINKATFADAAAKAQQKLG